MTYLTYTIDYLIYERAYLFNRVINRALHRVIILPPHSPWVPPIVDIQYPITNTERYPPTLPIPPTRPPMPPMPPMPAVMSESPFVGGLKRDQ